MEIFGDVLLADGQDINFEDLEKILKLPVVYPHYKLSVLHPDESVMYEIPPEDIPEGGISYHEEYTNGQRKSLTVELINTDGKYTPNINNNIWLNSRFRFDVGIEYKGDIIWFPKGIYVMGDISVVDNDAEKTVSLQLKDKFNIFEGKTGTLEDAYEVELDSNIADVLTGILNFDMGDGYILDYKQPILDQSFIGFKTQATIRVEEGGNFGQIISELATQLSAEYYYNSIGNLCFYPINETVSDESKPIVWVFEKLNRDLHNLNLNYANEEVVNKVKVVGENIDNGISSAIVENTNPASPICVQRIGRRAAPTYTETSVWNEELAYDMANYYLRQNSFLAVDFSCNVSFNPILTVNNICEVENDFIGMKREKLLITSISYSSQDGLTSLKMCNTSDLPSNTK